MLRLLGMLAAAAAAKSKCKEFKCYGKKEAAPKTPYFAPSDDGLCPEGVAAELGPCCLARDACTSVCGATEDMCAAEFRKCAEVACDAVDDVDDMDKCKEDGALGADSPWRDGCEGHARGQKEACQCLPRGGDGGGEVANRRRQILGDVYRRYNGTGVDAGKTLDLASRADSPKRFAALVFKLAAKFPKLLSDARPPKAPKQRLTPRKPSKEDLEEKRQAKAKRREHDKKLREEKKQQQAEATDADAPPEEPAASGPVEDDEGDVAAEEDGAEEDVIDLDRDEL